MNLTDYIIKHYTPANYDMRSEDNRFDSQSGQVEFLTISEIPLCNL